MDDPLTPEQVASLESRAEAADLEAQYELGWRSALGAGLPLDDEVAVDWLVKAASNGHALAQNNLGARCRSGDGVPKDLVEAFKWFSLAAARGDRKAGKNRDSVATELNAEQLAEGRRRAGDSN